MMLHRRIRMIPRDLSESIVVGILGSHEQKLEVHHIVDDNL